MSKNEYARAIVLSLVRVESRMQGEDREKYARRLTQLAKTIADVAFREFPHDRL